MVIGFLCLDIYLPYCHSLKEKRRRLKSINDRFKNKYNVAFAELDYQNKWQRTRIGMVSLNTKKKVVDSLFNKIIKESEDKIDGEIIDYQISYF